ncbi:MAG: ATP-binding cassette domain-containing protein [bacterium]|nr:ATP-binding cassette domain-containing protein [bacterium]
MIGVHELTVRAGTFVMSDVSFTVPAGAYAVLMGKTGCGKSTLLETVCGLHQASHGRIELMGRDVTHSKAAERGIGYVPQDGVLFPTMSVRDHLAFALRIRKWPRSAVDDRVRELADLLGIAALLDRRPAGLSGGEAQRVSLGRALAAHPPILCLDEPLSALDHDTRVEMCDLLERVRGQSGVTTLHVTHDRNEAARLADTILRIEDGEVRVE